MKHDATEFAKQLLAADPAFNSPQLNEQRRNLFERLQAAERREHLGRRLTWLLCGISFAGTSLLLLAAAGKIDTTAWPDQTKFAAVTAIILLPVFALLILGIYLFSHRRNLRAAKHELERQALADLPRQIADLRRELNELRERKTESEGRRP